MEKGQEEFIVVDFDCNGLRITIVLEDGSCNRYVMACVLASIWKETNHTMFHTNAIAYFITNPSTLNPACDLHPMMQG